MTTKVIIGCPSSLIEKRKARITEALSIKFQSENEPVKYVIDTLVDGTEIYFIKPGKEYFRKKEWLVQRV